MRDLRVFRCVEAYPGIAAGRAGRARSNGRPSGDRASGERQPDERVRAGISGWARAGCGRHCAVRPMKLTACTIISKPQNTGLLVNQKASYRRKQTRRASRWAAGQSGAMGWQRIVPFARCRRSSVGLRCRRGTRSAFGAGGAPWSRPVRMPGCGARFAAGAGGTLEHGRCDEAVGGARSAFSASGMPWSRPVRMPGCGVRSAFGTSGTLGSAGLQRGQSPEMRPCFVWRPFSALEFAAGDVGASPSHHLGPFAARAGPMQCLANAPPSSSGPFCRKTAPNLTSPLNFWAVFEGLFCAELL